MTDSKRRPNRLREHREAAGLTQQELADQAGAGRVTIVRAEQGSQAPSLDLADRLADALYTTIDELFSSSDRATYDDGYRDGRQAEREDRAQDRARTASVEPDTPAPAGEEQVAAFIRACLHARPAAPDHTSIWYAPDPRGVSRRLDAVVYVQVLRRAPRAARRLYEQLVADMGIGDDTTVG